jgi:hypothetical protein
MSSILRRKRAEQIADRDELPRGHGGVLPAPEMDTEPT